MITEVALGKYIVSMCCYGFQQFTQNEACRPGEFRENNCCFINFVMKGLKNTFEVSDKVIHPE